MIVRVPGEPTYPNDPRHEKPTEPYIYELRFRFMKGPGNEDPQWPGEIEDGTVEDDEPLTEEEAIHRVEQNPTAYSDFLENEDDGWAEYIETL